MVYQPRTYPLMVFIFSIVAIGGLFWLLSGTSMRLPFLCTAGLGLVFLAVAACSFLRAWSEVEAERFVSGHEEDSPAALYIHYMKRGQKLERYGWGAFMIGMVILSITLTFVYCDRHMS